VKALAWPRSAALGEVTLDLDRARRCGFPEVVYGEGKSTSAMEKIFRRLLSERLPVLATRVSPEQAAALAAPFPQGRYNELARTFRIEPAGEAGREKGGASRLVGKVPIVTAGTSDLPVAEEARETLDWMGVETVMIHDVGVAGPHRLPEQLARLAGADAVVVVAGAEGALPSVVGGYLACPVVGVPTSVGYGASFGGVSALLSMLNSCAANVTVVNINAGFKGGYVAGLIAHGRAARDGIGAGAAEKFSHDP
jgi:NCAIR mutase (PurE)-related protein